MRTRTNNRAFTLIEILIVVVILGILAAIVIPQFTDASDDAMDASVRSQLQTIRSQIELHNVQNPADEYDNTTAADNTFWDNLVNRNYLQQAPRNPMQNGSTTVAAAAAVGVGWVWDAANEDISAVNTTGGLFVE
jgi:prepilin-type N-terminal cleavage/methylation domain-containing protein